MNYNSLDFQYLQTLERLLEQKDKDNFYNDRTNTGIYKIFGNMISVPITDGFPLLVSRAVPFKSLLTEFLFFVHGHTNNMWLEERNCKFWSTFAHPVTGELGPIYGAQLRNFNNSGYDQLEHLIDGLKNNPFSRRHIFTYMNPIVFPDESKSHQENIENGKAVLPPCHVLYQFDVRNSDGEMFLDGMLTMRSSDWCVGAPSNIAQMGLWIYTLARICGYKPGNLVFSTGNTHIYSNHIEPAEAQLSLFKNNKMELKYPTLMVGEIKDIGDIDDSKFMLSDYSPIGTFKFPLAT